MAGELFMHRPQMKITKKTSFLALAITLCLICASSAFGENAVGDLNVIAPSTYLLEAGESGIVNVSFSGMGIDSFTLTASGFGLTAKTAGASWKPYPNTCVANIAITTTNDFRDGTITFQLNNNTHGIIKSDTIYVRANSVAKEKADQEAAAKAAADRADQEMAYYKAAMKAAKEKAAKEAAVQTTNRNTLKPKLTIDPPL